MALTDGAWEIPTMTTYQITSSAGVDMGTYEAESPDAALDAMARDAGYESQADAAATVGAFDGTVRKVTHITITVPADADQDDCLAAAAEAYIAEHPELSGWDLSPVWGDETRETVALTVPAWAVSEVQP